jgi:hypothetical protein
MYIAKFGYRESLFLKDHPFIFLANLSLKYGNLGEKKFLKTRRIWAIFSMKNP